MAVHRNYLYGILASTLIWSSTSFGQTSDTFDVNITIEDSCELTTPATDMSFGTVQLLNTAYTATSTVSVTCTTDAAYDLALDQGGNDSATTRRMADVGATNFVSYRLYSDSGHSALWGDGTTFGSVKAGTGTGIEQDITVYGRVEAGDNATTPPAGTYSDTVTVSVTF
ncbi:MAG: spore coat U domain-containing protein [Zhongshania sp.]|uniref:Csu type fimbrial protein n=1 Tax=Zhongshania sp. TaxID=1971902 RepID=UPI00260A325A|nr:spore coat U domain-containing protein [Zhongshania sp.]MDF1693280.1 spore coat U domain-containing protein [Zhongshania sp.]